VASEWRNPRPEHGHTEFVAWTSAPDDLDGTGGTEPPMLELRLTADVKRIAAMRDAIRRECERSKAGPEHAEAVAYVVEQLVGVPESRSGTRSRVWSRRSGDVFVVVTVQSDATMLMIRDTRPERSCLDETRDRLLEEHTSHWSTMSGRDGRTVWAEVARVVATPPVQPAPSVQSGRPPRPDVSTAPARRVAPPVATNA
jgi:hypothetical protein